MSRVNIWIHAVWGTKRRLPYLANFKETMINHIRENAIKKNIFIDRIDGDVDHLHCLFKLNATMSVSRVMQLIKGESSCWANKNKIFRNKFEWCDDYYAASVSESDLDRVRRYIDNQAEHHKKNPRRLG